MDFFKSIIAYDGTEFHGFQRQSGGLRTVQGELEKALRTVGWSGGSLIAAGRTDAGVHARGQVIAFNLEWRAEYEELVAALNANLPDDIAVWHAERVTQDFHPRFSATGRRYEYSIYFAPIRKPKRERYSWRVWPKPDIKRLTKVGNSIIGSHDFAAFGQAQIEGGHTIREVTKAEWALKPGGLTFVIEANAFLYHMVRRLVAASIRVGQGKSDLDYFQDFLEDPTKRWKGSIAPPRGLSLERVYYSSQEGLDYPGWE